MIHRKNNSESPAVVGNPVKPNMNMNMFVWWRLCLRLLCNKQSPFHEAPNVQHLFVCCFLWPFWKPEWCSEMFYAWTPTALVVWAHAMYHFRAKLLLLLLVSPLHNSQLGHILTWHTKWNISQIYFTYPSKKEPKQNTWKEKPIEKRTWKLIGQPFCLPHSKWSN